VNLTREARFPHRKTSKVLELMDKHHSLMKSRDPNALVELTQGRVTDMPPLIQRQLKV